MHRMFKSTGFSVRIRVQILALHFNNYMFLGLSKPVSKCVKWGWNYISLDCGIKWANLAWKERKHGKNLKINLHPWKSGEEGITSSYWVRKGFMDKEAFSPDPLKCHKTATRVSVNGTVEQMKKIKWLKEW